MAHHQQPPYGGEQAHMGGPTHLDYGGPSMQQPPSRGSKRGHQELDMSMTELQDEGLHGIQQQQQINFAQQSQPLLEHHHRLPDTGPQPELGQRGEDYDDERYVSQAAPSVVGQPGMPPPAARPRGPKVKFTPEDDGLLVDLKENKSLTWKQIAEFFPGRSSGTLQVRYCTKLKAKTTQWSDETVSRVSN